MSEAQHDLATEFPAMKELIHDLKTKNEHFRGLMDKYHQLNKSIHRSEQRIDTLSEREEEDLRKARLKLKDELYGMLVQAQKN